MKHSELSKLGPTPCTAHHLTFGGRCLNCGYNPLYNDRVPVTQKEESPCSPA